MGGAPYLDIFPGTQRRRENLQLSRSKKKVGTREHTMITYKLEYSNENEIKYIYYPWHDTGDTGFIISDRKGNVIQKHMTKADDLYPDYYNEMVGIAYRNAVS